MIEKIRPKLKLFSSLCWQKILRFYFRKLVSEKKYCIISNDCWAGELYKILNAGFNTPFIGLMMMSPCYIKLLENPRYYLALPLVFKKRSKYPAMVDINAGIDFPLACLGESGIEIQFLHYKNEATAMDKWTRRVARMDWNNLFVKYDCGKDYASVTDIEKFISFPYTNKLLFGKDSYSMTEVIVLDNYAVDAVIQFRHCFLNLDPVGWIVGRSKISNRLQRFICRNAYKYL